MNIITKPTYIATALKFFAIGLLPILHAAQQDGVSDSYGRRSSQTIAPLQSISREEPFVEAAVSVDLDKKDTTHPQPTDEATALKELQQHETKEIGKCESGINICGKCNNDPSHCMASKLKASVWICKGYGTITIDSESCYNCIICDRRDAIKAQRV